MAKPIYARRGTMRNLHPLKMERVHHANQITTTVFISNLHCSSCVHTIQDALSSLSPPPTSVDISVVTQSVTVVHPLELSPSLVKSTIDDAGFDLVETPNEDATQPSLSLSQSLSRIPSLLTARRRQHLSYCAQCRAEHTPGHAPEDGPSIDDVREIVGEETVPDSGSQKGSEVTCTNAEKPHPLISGRPTEVISSPLQTTAVPHNVTLSIGGMTCVACSNTITDVGSQVAGVSNLVVNLLGHSATATVQNSDAIPRLVSVIEDAGYDAEVIDNQPIRIGSQPSEDTSRRLTLSIGGMTCAACTTTITNLVSELDGVEDISVNLLGKSATVILKHEKLVPQVVEIIEDAGYDAEVISVESLIDSRDGSATIGPRSIALRVNGMFCQHCPPKVMAALSALGPSVIIDKPLISHTDPILRVTYVPSPPSFTIRTVIQTITNASNPEAPFTVSVHHPPTLEVRARPMQMREQNRLLQRLLFSVIVAIPTFIIAIVYMSLVPSGNETRRFFERPMWAGNAARVQWVLLFLATPVMFYSAGTFHRRSLKELWALWKPGSRTPVWKRLVRFGSMNLLVSSGVSVAYFASIALLALAASQSRSSDDHGDTTTYFDSVVFLTMFLLAGRFLEAYSKGRTSDAITALGKLRPTSAFLLVPTLQSNDAETASSPALSSHSEQDLEKGDIEKEDINILSKRGFKVEKVDVELLEVGDVVRVQHGASPPADGTVVAGEGGAFDESSLTGESRLVKKQVGDEVFLGTINKAGVVDVRVDAIGGETMLDHVVKVVREGQTRRAPIERLADLLTGYFVPVITLLAIITWVIWLALGLSGSLPPSYLDIDVGGWTVWSLEFAIAVFVVACPCGIGLAAPTALLVGSGLAAKHGILARGGGEAFQEAAQLDIIVFDKTGTLTEGGEPRVTDAEVLTKVDDGRWTTEAVLGIAAELESASSHPLATAIRNYCQEKAITPQNASAFEEVPGRGLKASFSDIDCTAIIGNEAWMATHSCPVDAKVKAILDTWKTEGKSVILLALCESSDVQTSPSSYFIAAIFAVADPLRPEAKGVISRLQSSGLGTWMISGDNEVTAKAVARMVGIPETNVIAGVLPHEKAEKINWLQQNGQKKPLSRWQRFFKKQRLNAQRCIVGMVGDGINDAPALTAADVGIAIGSGSDVAMSSASFILVSSNLRSLLTLTDLSRKVFNRVKFNFLWAIVYNAIGLPIAAGVIYPAGHARLAPVWASLAMALSSTSVVCSSLLLRLYKEPSIQDL